MTAAGPQVRPAGFTPRDRLVGVGLAIVGVATFLPVRHADFQADDLVRLYDLANWGLAKLLLSPHGGHLLEQRELLALPIRLRPAAA